MLAIPKDEMLPLPDGRIRQARAWWALAPEGRFERRACADGAEDPREYDRAHVRPAPPGPGRIATC